MAEIKALLATILLLFLTPKASSKPSGFSLDLIRAYSPESSHSDRNVTFLERFESYVHASQVRASYWASFNKRAANKTIHPDVFQPALRTEGERYLVVMNIGTPPQRVFLVFDTGGILSWTQCAACTTCFPQTTAKFDPRRSRTYHEISSSDVNCRPPHYIKRGRQCLYNAEYIENQHTKGIASSDSFSSLDNYPGQTATGIRFGCSLEAVGFRFPSNTIISGSLGMSRDLESFPSQLRQRGGNGRFSYCLVDLNTAPRAITKVTFGNDIPSIPEEDLQIVSFVQHISVHGWAIHLIDISVGDEKLNLPPGTFYPNPLGGNGGLVLDTGSPLTYLPRVAYRAIKSKIQEHLSKRRGDFTDISYQNRLCYRYNGRTRKPLLDYLQTITLHLEDFAELDMRVTSVYRFNWADNTFCLGIVEAPTAWPNILGSLQQQDTRFIYDLNENSLSFTSVTCAP